MSQNWNKPKITVRRDPVDHRYIAWCLGEILMTGETAQAVANYMAAMQLVAHWDVHP